MKRLKLQVLGLVGLLSFVIPASTQAAVPIVPAPAGLNPGDTYRLIFVTNGTTTATSTDISTYNTFATDQANAQSLLADLGASWVVVGGTKQGSNAGGVTAAMNVGASTVPVYDLLGQKVGDSMPAIFAATSINQPVSTDQFGNTYLGAVVTGTADNGGSQNRPLGGHNTNFETRVGYSTVSTSNWLSTENRTASLINLPIYAISSPLTAVPEPASLSLLAAGAGLLLQRRRNA